MRSDRMDEQMARLLRSSEAIFGEAAEAEPAEAEELLRAAGIEPETLKIRLCQKMLKRAEEYSRAGRSLPPLLKQAVEDLRPDRDKKAEASSLPSTARLAVTRLLKEIEELPKRLSGGVTPALSAAYRNKKELSARDKKVLDKVAEDLRKRNKDGK
jgi:hypothetical protein